MPIDPQSTNPIALAKALMACPSVTPAMGAVFDVAEAALQQIGFAVHRSIDGDAPDGPVENLLATRTGAHDAPHFAFAGHLDVVPPGAGWTSDAFTPREAGGLLYGRGAVDMKSSIAAFIAAAAQIPPEAGTISLIITGDEEGPAVHGTLALMGHMEALRICPDMCLVGEPTSVRRLGDTVKVGRRGSVNIWISVPGVQGHVAYPHLADNPVPKLVRALAAIDAIRLDQGSEWFQPSNVEITDLEVGNPATNMIPQQAKARISIRFNDGHTGEALVALIRDTVAAHAPEAEVTAKISGEAFLSPPGDFAAMVRDAITAECGVTPEFSTSGGTSDARFLHRLCPIAEFGLPNATMHKLDEAVAIDDIALLTRVYARILRAAFRMT